MLVNESTARKYWGTAQKAVGARLDLWGAQRTVAGVVGDIRDMPWHDAAVPAVYFPQPQMWYPQPMFLIVRADVDPALLFESIRRAIHEIDPALPLANVRTLDTVAGAAIATRRLTLWLVAAFGLTALFLAIVGIYGVMSYSVTQRRQEVGIRMALGARAGQVIHLVLREAMALAAIGIAIGVLLSLGVTRLLGSLLFEVSATDVTTFIVTALILAAVAAIASYIPARRAAGVDPLVALRSEQ